MCADGYYFDSFGACQPCFFGCVTCAGPFSNQCLTCRLNSDRHTDGSCSCRPGYQFNQLTGNCDPIQNCHASCNLCTRANDMNACVGCRTNAMLSSASSCICNENFYMTSAGACASCHSSCLTCRGPLGSDCLSCRANSIYDPAARTCTCPSGFYTAATANSDCLGCHNSCLTCADGSNQGCRSCKVFASIVTVASRSSCVCNQGYQMDANGDCIKINCRGACSICTSD